MEFSQTSSLNSWALKLDLRSRGSTFNVSVGAQPLCVFVAVLVCVGLLRVSTHGGVPPKLNYETLLAIGMGIFMATASPCAF